MPQTSHRIYAFGDFALDLTTGWLLRNSEPVKLRPKAFEALRYLVENANRLVSKDELVKVVWADAIVSDNSLVQCLKEVRAALGDDAHIIIKTVPRRGYIFAAEVSENPLRDSGALYAEQLEGIKIVIEETAESDAPTADQYAGVNLVGPRSGTVKTWGRLGKALHLAKPLQTSVLVPAFVLLATIGGYYFWAQKTSPAKSSKPAFSIDNIRLTSLTSSGNAYGPVISPDGKFLAYSTGSTLCVQQVATGSVTEIAPPTPAQLRGLVRYWAITFSPDSNYVYYVLADDGENVAGNVYRIAVMGGRSQKILERAGSISISPDGRRLAFKRSNAPPGLLYLMVSDADGANQQVISTVDTNSDFMSLDWSPDGARLLYTLRQHTVEGYLHYVAETPAAGGPESRIIQPRREKIIGAKWLPDKSGLIMNAIDPETNLPQLYYVSYPDGAEQRITNDLNNYKGVSITANGRALVAEISSGMSQLWVAPEGDTRRARQLAGSMRGWYHNLAWLSPDELVYNSDENGVRQIWKMTVDGRNRQQLTTGPGQNTEPSVTPDGRFIVFFSTRSGSGQIWRMTANGDDPVQLTRSTVGVFKPQCSPDGEWVYYTADVQGRWQVWKVPIAGGEVAMVEDAPVEQWAVSPDGKMLAYSFFDEQPKRRRVAVRGLDAPESLRYFDISPERMLQWTSDGRALTFVQPLANNTNIWLQPVDGRPARALTQLAADQWVATFAWSPDGKSLAYTRTYITFDAALLQLK